MRPRGRVTGRTAGASPLQMSLWSNRDASPGWNVRISRRARRLSMRVFPGGRVEVVVPPGVGVPAVERFVARHRDWAVRRSHELKLHAPEAAERRPGAIELAATGERWTVEYESVSRPGVVQTAPAALRVGLAVDSDAEVSQRLVRWLTARAHRHRGRLLDGLSMQTGIDYAHLQLRRQRTRWGSCSSAGAISLNVCLMFQRPEVVTYLLVHELCHRRQMNHSRRFWDLVGSFVPDWRNLDAELLKGWRNVPGWVFS
jgi:predicted metal-dependent hydrolase